jgi:methyl-accepting chemotaxis protein
MLTSIEDVNTTVHQLSSASQEMSNSVDEIHTFMQEIEHHAQSAAEISGNVSEQAKEGLHAVAVVIEGIQTIKTTVQDAAATIQRLEMNRVKLAKFWK